MVSQLPVMRSRGAQVLFLVGAFVTVTLLLWMHQMRLSGELHGLTTIFFFLFAWQDYGATICALLILTAAVLLPGDWPARRVLSWAGEHPMRIALVSLAALCVGALGVYHNHPLSMDEYAAYFQSQAFAAGHLAGQFPLPAMNWLIPPGFQDDFLNVSPVTGHVASPYWPAFALLLTPFTWAGIPWACNPLISALTLLAIHRLALTIFEDREAAGTALLLTVASPVFFAIGISYYSMPAHLLANTVFALLLTKPSPARAFGAGVVGSIALTLHNPVPHILFALPWILWTCTRARGALLLGALCAGYLPLCAVLGVGWYWFSGQLVHEGAAAMTAAGASGGLRGLGELFGKVFGAPTATIVLARWIGVAKVWVWAVPGLMILAVTGAVRWRHNTLCRLFSASALLTLVGYLFVPMDQGHGWGYRYFHSVWMALPVLATAALFRPRPTVVGAPSTDGGHRMFEDTDTRSFVAVCTLLCLVFGVGFRVVQMREFMAADLKQVPNYHGTERRFVIIDTGLSFYGADLVQNDPWLRGNVIRMFSHGAAEDKKMMTQYYPTWHKVYGDRFGTVWSQAK